MPESKLAEKLGFRVAMRDGRPTVFHDDRNQRYAASEEEIALWNLCLELNAENEKLVKELQQFGLRGASNEF